VGSPMWISLASPPRQGLSGCSVGPTKGLTSMLQRKRTANLLYPPAPPGLKMRNRGSELSPRPKMKRAHILIPEKWELSFGWLRWAALFSDEA